MSTVTTMTTALSDAQQREDEHEKHTQGKDQHSQLLLAIDTSILNLMPLFRPALLARLSVVRGEDLFRSLEDKLRDASAQLVTAKARVLELENLITTKVITILCFPFDYRPSMFFHPIF